MQDLGQKVVQLNLRVNKVDKNFGLTPLKFEPRFSSGYENLLVNQVANLNVRVVRLERFIGIATNRTTPSNVQLKNIAMKINSLCQRIITLEEWKI